MEEKLTVSDLNYNQKMDFTTYVLKTIYEIYSDEYGVDIDVDLKFKNNEERKISVKYQHDD